jgi:hypothetical protein
VAQQSHDLHAPPRRQQVEDGQSAILVELHQQVRGVIAFHARQQGRHLHVGALPQELQLVLLVELLEDVGLELLVLGDRLHDLLALVMGGRLHQVCDLGGVQPREAAMGESQPRGGHVADERLELGPLHQLDVLGLAASQATRKQAPHASAEARVDAGDSPDAVIAHELDLARHDQPRRYHVDHAVPEHVRAQQHLSRPALEPGQVELGGRGASRRRLEPRDPIRRDEQFTAADPGLQPADQRQAIASVEPGDHVLHTPQSRASRVEQRAAGNRG